MTYHTDQDNRVPSRICDFCEKIAIVAIVSDENDTAYCEDHVPQRKPE